MVGMKLVYDLLRARLGKLTKRVDVVTKETKIHQGTNHQRDTAKRDVSISSVPTVTSSGHMFWNARDIIFSDSRKEAADALSRDRKKQDTK
jgi:hypothetical protein